LEKDVHERAKKREKCHDEWKKPTKEEREKRKCKRTAVARRRGVSLFEEGRKPLTRANIQMNKEGWRQSNGNTMKVE